MRELINKVTKDKHNMTKYPRFRSGDTIQVHIKVTEGEKQRIQKFKGLVIKVQGKDMGKSFTVRKISSGVGVEKTFPFSSPSIEKVEVISKGKVRQSRIYYIRKLFGKKARIESTLVTAKEREQENAQ